MFNFEHINILCAWIRHLSEKLWEFKLLESFHYSLSSVSLYHGPHTYTRVKRCHCLNFPRVSVFILEPLDILCAWLGHPWKVMTIWISREIQLFIVKRPNISWASYIHPSQKFWQFEFAESFSVQFRASQYIMRLNRTSEWKVMTLWISRGLPLFIVEHLIISWALHIHPSKNLSLLEFFESFRVHFGVSRYIMRLTRTSVKSYDHLNFWRDSVFHCLAYRYIMGLTHTLEAKFLADWICQELQCSISSVLIYYAPESDIRVKIYEHLNFSRASVVHRRASRYIIGLIHTLKSKVMAAWICQELPYSV